LVNDICGYVARSIVRARVRYYIGTTDKNNRALIIGDSFQRRHGCYYNTIGNVRWMGDAKIGNGRSFICAICIGGSYYLFYIIIYSRVSPLAHSYMFLVWKCLLQKSLELTHVVRIGVGR
jgi:hypothetical protein